MLKTFFCVTKVVIEYISIILQQGLAKVLIILLVCHFMLFQYLSFFGYLQEKNLFPQKYNKDKMR
jgi:hypothetical protein